MAEEQNQELVILLNHQARLWSILESQDVKDFSEDLSRCNLITDQMKRDFATLDVDARLDQRQQLRLRYLLQLVQVEVCQNKSQFGKLLDLLKNYSSELKSLCEYLMDRVEFLSTEERGAVDQVQDIDKRITKDYIPDLVEKLASAADKWEEIALALNIPHHKRVDIRKSGKASIVQLGDVLHEWVTGSSDALSFSVLEKVLAGKIVNRPNLAASIKTVEPANKQTCLDWSYSGSELTICYFSVQTEIAYGKSTLLEVQVNNYTSSSLSYQWYKDGHELSDCDNYQGTKYSILLVKHKNMANKHVEGNYVCQVDITIYSPQIPLKVCYPGRIKHLLDKYQKLEEIPKDSWPPRCAKSFVELALINRNSDEVREYDYSIRGNMDDVLMKKDKIDYSEAFGEHRSGALVLVEGRPGCGKTTLAHKVTRDWSRGEKVLVGAELVFLVSLRILSVTQKDRDIDELMEQFYCSKSDVSNVGQYLLSSGGDKVCFIFDGLDEYLRKNERTNTFVVELINGKLPKAMIIIFSRPVGTLQLKRSGTVRRQIEILGFKKNQIHSYIDSYFHTNADKAQSLIEYLDQHMNVLHMCYLPVHASMICYLYSQLGDNIPTTETQIYTQFATSTYS